MNKKVSRILSFIVMAVLIMSAVSVFSFAEEITIKFTIGPSVLIGGGDEYNVVWHNNMQSIGWVTYTYNGTEYTVFDEEDGVIRTDDNIHSVRIPIEHLDGAGGYVACAATVESRLGNDIKISSNSVKATRSFTGCNKKGKLSIGFISDVHLLWNNKAKYDSMLESIATSIDDYMNTPDLVVLNGDITNNMQAEGEFIGLFRVFEVAGHNGTTPILYVVGNHEKRGKFSIKFEKYLTFDTGELYTSFDIGDCSVFVTDIGEDKTDDHIEYGGLIDMDHYFEEQYNWFKSQNGYTADATYKFTIGHSPSYIDRYLTDEMVSVFSGFGTDVHIAGHSHQLRYYSSTKKVNYPVVHDGGHNDNANVRTMLLTLENGTYSFKGFDPAGGTLFEQDLSASANDVQPVLKGQPVTHNSVDTEHETEDIPTKAGASTTVLKGASDTTALTTHPVVFDAGDYYNIVWQTTPGVPCAGYVELSGEKKEWKDSHGGKLRTETTHSVRIPKEKLDGKKYTVKNRVVTNYNAYGTYNQNDPTSYGPYSTGSQIEFRQPTQQSSYTVLAVANENGGRQAAWELKKLYSSKPDMLVLLGDMTSGLDKERSFADAIEYAYEITGGAYPVTFVRGENEKSGEYAANLGRFIRPKTTKSINDFSFDIKTYDKSFAVLDSYSADRFVSKLDNSFAGKYNVVFTHSQKDVKSLPASTQLVVSADMDADLLAAANGYSVANMSSAKALVLTFAQDKISVSKIDDAVSEVGHVTLTGEAVLSDGSIIPTPTPDPEPQPQPQPETKPDNQPDIDTSEIFGDVRSGKWYTKAIDYAYYNGFIAGVSETEFGINTPVTRGMFVTILARIAGVSTSGGANKVQTEFTDVKSGKYYTAAIKWGYENGVVSGMSKTTFEPNSPITRQQLCVMITNFASKMSISLTEKEGEIAFTDNNGIAKWAKKAVAICQKADIVNGYNDASGVIFKPGATATRAEAAQILYKFHFDYFE